MPKRSPAEAAAREAFEEAGVEGDIHPDCLGIYRHAKSGGVDCAVAVYPLRVRRTHSRFPEKCQRKRKWMSPKRAAAAVDNAELAGIIASFDPKALAS